MVRSNASLYKGGDVQQGTLSQTASVKLVFFVKFTLCSCNKTALLILASSSLGLTPRFHCDAWRSCDWLFCFFCVATHSSLGFSEFPAFRSIKTAAGISPLCIWALSSWKGCTQVLLTASEVQMMGCRWTKGWGTAPANQSTGFA